MQPNESYMQLTEKFIRSVSEMNANLNLPSHYQSRLKIKRKYKDYTNDLSGFKK